MQCVEILAGKSMSKVSYRRKASAKKTRRRPIVLAAPVVRRFSASSLIAVTGMALTGLVNTIFIVGSFQALLASAYGQELFCKSLVLLLCWVCPAYFGLLRRQFAELRGSGSR